MMIIIIIDNNIIIRLSIITIIITIIMIRLSIIINADNDNFRRGVATGASIKLAWGFVA